VKSPAGPFLLPDVASLVSASPGGAGYLRYRRGERKLGEFAAATVRGEQAVQIASEVDHHHCPGPRPSQPGIRRPPGRHGPGHRTAGARCRAVPGHPGAKRFRRGGRGTGLCLCTDWPPRRGRCPHGGGPGRPGGDGHHQRPTRPRAAATPARSLEEPRHEPSRVVVIRGQPSGRSLDRLLTHRHSFRYLPPHERTSESETLRTARRRVPIWTSARPSMCRSGRGARLAIWASCHRAASARSSVSRSRMTISSVYSCKSMTVTPPGAAGTGAGGISTRSPTPGRQGAG
jgi:hypothetical protein